MSPLKLILSGLGIFAAAGFGFGMISHAVPHVDAPAPAAAVAAAPQTLIASGTFSGLSDHITTGQVRLVKTAAGYEIILGEDFSLDGAPDPIVGFGKDGTYVKASKVGALKAKTGGQSYSLPSHISLAELNEIYIWCERFAVPLGAAQLSPAT